MRAPLAALLLFSGGALAAPAADAPRMADLAWLAGDWRGTLANGATFETHYTDASGGTIVSVSKEHRDTRTLGFELEVFFEKDGKVFYQPYPNGRRSEHVFPLVSLDRATRRAVFENKEHDFPQTFVFEQASPDRLVITLRGPRKDGTPREIHYELYRIR